MKPSEISYLPDNYHFIRRNRSKVYHIIYEGQEGGVVKVFLTKTRDDQFIADIFIPPTCVESFNLEITEYHSYLKEPSNPPEKFAFLLAKMVYLSCSLMTEVIDDEDEDS